MKKHPETLGIVLAGGLSRRMGGGDKGLLPLAGRSILERVLDRFRPQCAALILNVNGDATRFGDLGLPVAPDTVPGFPGPLAGILAGLDWAAEHRPDLAWVATAAGDIPFLPRDLVSRLHEVRETAGASLASAASGGRVHPVNGIWPVAVRADLRRAIVHDGERKVGRWVARHGGVSAEWDGTPDPFFNVNTPDDLAEAERLAAHDGHQT